MKAKRSGAAGWGALLLGLALMAGCGKNYQTGPTGAAPIAPAAQNTPVLVSTVIPTPTAITVAPASSPTATSIPSTATPTSTPTSTSTFTSTPTSTSTATPTSTSTSTATSIPTPIPTAWVVEGTTANFNQEVLDSPVPVLVEFYATWCSACAYMGPAVLQFAQDYAGKVKVVRINADTQPGLMSTYSITGLPTCLLFKNGVLKSRFAGAYGDTLTNESQLVAMLNAP